LPILSSKNAAGATIVVHLGSIWVAFGGESKEAVADYPEITKEIRLTIADC